jgi:hypothetical protein
MTIATLGVLLLLNFTFSYPITLLASNHSVQSPYPRKPVMEKKDHGPTFDSEAIAVINMKAGVTRHFCP